VVATGETHSVQDFLERVFDLLKLDWHKHIQTDPRYLRPAEVDLLQGDSSKARRLLGWKPRVNFERLVEMMVEADLELAEREKRSRGH
jgi:GDPmannose 4,6-dehydratase